LKLLYISLITSTLLFSNSDYTSKINETDNIKDTESTLIIENPDKYTDTYTDIAILKNLKNKPKQNYSKAIPEQIVFNNLIHPITDSQSDKNNKTTQKVEKISQYTGYCYPYNDITVGFLKDDAIVNCELHDLETNKYINADLSIQLYPTFKKQALLAIVGQTIKINNNFLPVIYGTIKNANKNSLNIADEIDFANLQIALKKGLKGAGDIAYNNIKAYNEAKRASLTTEELSTMQVTDENGNTSNRDTKITNTKAPNKQDYIDVAFVETMKLIADILADEIDTNKFMFKYKSIPIYVELLVSDDKSKLLTIKNNTKNLPKW